ncbi:hypothetical protein AVEN_250322-1 [Araneus ventricosus]|uniref:Uncharacterized protein n=1 Tax=Araneus ventricosus TaxID=182803 RepID=A0A4Y2FJ04_ARAVE|nr:hypothetical protein AVEN_250322-1 [Araneus ventricosus]
MRKWKTNSETLQRKWEEGENSNIISSANSGVKVLGYISENKGDVMKLSLPEINLNPDQVITKRLMLGIIRRLCDPIEFIDPFTVTSKVLMQDCWRAGSEWDNALSIDIQRRFRCWYEDFVHPREIKSIGIIFGTLVSLISETFSCIVLLIVVFKPMEQSYMQDLLKRSRNFFR